MLVDFGWFVGGCGVDCVVSCVRSCFVVCVVCSWGGHLSGMLVVGGAFVFVCVVVCLCDGWVLRCWYFCIRMYGSGCMMA